MNEELALRFLENPWDGAFNWMRCMNAYLKYAFMRRHSIIVDTMLDYTQNTFITLNN